MRKMVEKLTVFQKTVFFVASVLSSLQINETDWILYHYELSKEVLLHSKDMLDQLKEYKKL